MSHYPDLAPFDYFGAEFTDAFGPVGWLAPDHDYPKGRLTRREHNKLAALSREPYTLYLTLGRYNCEMCGRSLSTADLFIPYGSRVFVAPGGILHYVELHDYLPPEEFRRAVLGCPPMASTAYFGALTRTDWASIARKKLEVRLGKTLEAFLDSEHRGYIETSDTFDDPFRDAYQDRIQLTASLKSLATERLEWLRSLGFNALTKIEPATLRLTGPWGRKGRVETDVSKLSENTPRVAVLYEAKMWLWPSYLHFYNGFRIHRDGSYQDLTEADYYALDFSDAASPQW
jgi:hypothetical protein